MGYNNVNFNDNDEILEGLLNTYDIVMGLRSYPEIISDENRPHFFLFDPLATLKKEDLKEILNMLEDYEEYEKCGEIINLINGFTF